MTTVGLIGSGNIGSVVARLAVDAGHDVVLSNSRGPGTLAELVGKLGAQAKAATDEYAVMIDTRDALDVAPGAAQVEFAGYVDSWKGSK